MGLVGPMDEVNPVVSRPGGHHAHFATFMSAHINSTAVREFRYCGIGCFVLHEPILAESVSKIYNIRSIGVSAWAAETMEVVERCRATECAQR